MEFHLYRREGLEPRQILQTATVNFARLVDRRNNSSNASAHKHRVAYAYEADGRTFCATGSVVNPDADAAEFCAERLREIERGTYEVLDALSRDAWRINVIFDSDDPWRSFPVETRESPWRLTLIGAGFATRGDWIRARGLNLPRYRDSIQELFGSYNTTRTEVYTIGQVEILRGPASVLYGQGSPGGIVNVVSKTPTARPRPESPGPRCQCRASMLGPACAGSA